MIFMVQHENMFYFQKELEYNPDTPVEAILEQYLDVPIPDEIAKRLDRGDYMELRFDETGSAWRL